MSLKNLTRRQFIASSSAAVCGSALLSSCSSSTASVPTSVDQVTLGKSGMKCSRLGFGTGSVNSGTIQMALGQEEFNTLIHYAYDQGVTYFDTSVGYRTAPWIPGAIKGLPREKLFIQSKLERNTQNPAQAIEDLRKALNLDYIDSVLVHGASAANWPEECKALMDALSEAKQKKTILAHGVSYHGIPAQQVGATMDWIDINLIRYNPQGVYMDPVSTEQGAQSDASSVPVVEEQIKAMRARGQGILGMKIFGEGRLVEAKDHERSIKYSMQSGMMDAIVIGFKSAEEVDEAIWRMNRALAQLHAEARSRQAVLA